MGAETRRTAGVALPFDGHRGERFGTHGTNRGRRRTVKFESVKPVFQGCCINRPVNGAKEHVGVRIGRQPASFQQWQSESRRDFLAAPERQLFAAMDVQGERLGQIRAHVQGGGDLFGKRVDVGILE